MQRPRAALGLVVGVATCCLVASCTSAAKSATSPPALVGTQLNTSVPKSLLNLPLTDQSGNAVSLGSFSGKVVVISDLTTLCQETCAISTASMLQAARAVDSSGLTSKIEFLSITIDPGRDDQRHLAAYRRLFGALPNWKLLSGSTADINRLWDTLGIWRRTVSLSAPYPRDWLTHQPLSQDIQHSDDLIFIDQQQRFRFEIEGPGSVLSPNALPAGIYAFMDRMGHQNVRYPSAGSWSPGQVTQVLHWLVGAGEQG